MVQITNVPLPVLFFSCLFFFLHGSPFRAVMRDAVYYTVLCICIPVQKSVFLIMSKQIMFWLRGEAGWGWRGAEWKHINFLFTQRNKYGNTVVKTGTKEEEKRGHRISMMSLFIWWRLDKSVQGCVIYSSSFVVIRSLLYVNGILSHQGHGKFKKVKQ